MTPTIPVFGPGDALIFDFLLPHRTMMHERLAKTRYCIEAWFIAPEGLLLKDGPMVY